MSTAVQKPANQNTTTSPKAFRDTVTMLATSLLSDWVGADRAGEAVGRVASALSSAAASAKNPQDFYDCTPQSIGAVVAISALTGIMPSTGANALAYAIPRRARKNEKPQLRYQLSHRGLAALCKRAGMLMIPTPIGLEDVIEVDESGSVEIKSRDLDNQPSEMEHLRGVVVVIRDLATGHKLYAGWVPKKLILERRECSDAFKYAESDKGEWAKDSDPWHKWPVEMAMKTAMHYAVGRGWCVIDDTSATRALSMDVESDRVIEGSAVPVVTGKVVRKLDDLTDRLTQTEPSNQAEQDATEQLKQPEGETVPTATPADNAKAMLDEFTKALPDKLEVNAVKELCTEFRAAIASSDWPEDLKAATDDQLRQLADERIAAIRSTRGGKS